MKNEQAVNQKKKMLRCVSSLIIFFLCLIIATNNVGIVRVNGDSMRPALMDNQIVMIRKGNQDLKHGDVAVYCLKEEYRIKRVIGVPGDVIHLSSKGIVINGVKILPYSYLGDEKSYVLKEDEYFMIGDNHLFSEDSRDYGPIKKENIIGKVF